jgi:hypothetical protein
MRSQAERKRNSVAALAVFVARLVGPDPCRPVATAFPEARGPTFIL